jgi:hypothetical protein
MPGNNVQVVDADYLPVAPGQMTLGLDCAVSDTAVQLNSAQGFVVGAAAGS